MTRKFSYESHHIGDGVPCGAVVVGVEPAEYSILYLCNLNVESRETPVRGANLNIHWPGLGCRRYI